MKRLRAFLVLFALLITPPLGVCGSTGLETVTFQNGAVVLRGELYKPSGPGPFPVVLYNHGSAPGMLNSQAAAQLGPLYVSHGWAFFMPYRRGQGLSEKAGPYIGDEIDQAERTGGAVAGARVMLQRLQGDQLNDQLAALAWLKQQKWVSQKQIAVAGNSFGGIETILALAHEPFCAAVDASGGAESWEKSPDLQKVMKATVRSARSPVLFFQAENDFNVSPSKVLSEEMKKAGKSSEIKIYPPFGASPKEGHSFAYRGTKIWFDDVFKFLSTHCGDGLMSKQVLHGQHAE